ncbi:MAG: nucleotidyltransferase family protein [Gammaproteobacteria bacterium TMED1]|jgi:MurNAc alpha-1-phosphate uridylyltransferase|nr:MAG: nucleotidyltransferase family protein [Gammaproteobacteria bacterium TMED1]|tara:strand:- start:13449 stop:14111 length:663 start_codon:yes stop_codon:yes gene_type:complete
MKVMLLAAGEGRRMRPLTETIPKPLMQVGGETLIGRWLSIFSKAGYHEFVINTWHLEREIIDALGDGSRWGASIEYSQEPYLLETGGGIKYALPLLGSGPFIVVSSDVVSDFNPSNFPNSLDGALAHLILVENPRHHPKGDFSLDKNQKVKNSLCRLTYSGIGMFSPGLFEKAPRGKFKLRLLLDQAIVDSRVNGQKHDGFWIDVGTKQRYESLLECGIQ